MVLYRETSRNLAFSSVIQLPLAHYSAARLGTIWPHDEPSVRKKRTRQGQTYPEHRAACETATLVHSNL